MLKDKIRKQDIISIFKFSICWIWALVYKLFVKDVWIISERPKEARDNGYWIFKYIAENKLNKNAYYVICNGVDAEKVKSIGKTIKFGSLKHYFMYVVASKHVSTQIDGGMPNMRVCNFLERHKLLKNKKCFLQHGITKDVISFGFYKNTRVNLFVCAAKPETEFVKATFGYPEGAVQELGFARFDDLVDLSKDNKQILVMPTWRAWLAKNASQTADDANKTFIKSKYYKKWMEFLSDKNLNNVLEKYGYSLVFYPHSDMQPFVHNFKSDNDRIIIASDKTYNVQDLLKNSNLLITDYSSVAFDFAYIEKPIIYYHFDYQEYRKGQHPEGYFSYEEHGFGKVVNNATELVSEVENIFKVGEIEEIYKTRINDFFNLRDKNNCKRIYQAIENL